MSLLLVVAAGTDASAGGTPSGGLMWSFAVMTLALVLARRALWMRRAPMTGSGGNDSRTELDSLPTQDVDILDRNTATAVLLVGGENELGPFVLREFAVSVPEYRQVLFLSVGTVDSSVSDGTHSSWEAFQRSSEAKRLRNATRLKLDSYLSAAHELGLRADCRISIATDPSKEIGILSRSIARTFSRTLFFVGKIVFPHQRWYHRILHSDTSDIIRSALERQGLSLTVVPVVVGDERSPSLGSGS